MKTAFLVAAGAAMLAVITLITIKGRYPGIAERMLPYVWGLVLLAWALRVLIPKR